MNSKLPIALLYCLVLVACAPVSPSYFIEDRTNGARTPLVKQVVPDGYNIDGTPREGFTSYDAQIGGVAVSVSGVTNGVPETLTASTEVSHHTSLMFVHFANAGTTVSLAAEFDAEQPGFDDFHAMADFAETLRLCTSDGGCATLDGAPLRTGDIVIIRLP